MLLIRGVGHRLALETHRLVSLGSWPSLLLISDVEHRLALITHLLALELIAIRHVVSARLTVLIHIALRC